MQPIAIHINSRGTQNVNKFLLSINLIWLVLFIAALNSRDIEYLRWFGLWTCGMIGFGVGCAYKEQQFDDEERRELWELKTREFNAQEWERTHPDRCWHCGAAKEVADRR